LTSLSTKSPHNEKQEPGISAKFLSLLLNMAPRDGFEPTT
jgi:hypothetical protein